MVSEVQEERLRRMKEKHADGLLLWELRHGYELSPRESSKRFVSYAIVKYGGV